MDKFVEAIKEGNWSQATVIIDSEANSFSFARCVPEVAEQLVAVGENATAYCKAFLSAISLRYPDGRCEKSVGIAQTVIDNDVDTWTIDDSKSGVQRKVMLEGMTRISSGSMHPTVMQQAAQLIFYYLDLVGLIPDVVKDCKTWWRMPLI